MTNVKCKDPLYWIIIHIQINSWSTSRQQTVFLAFDLHMKIDYWVHEMVKWKKDGGYLEGSGCDLLVSRSIISHIFYKWYKIHGDIQSWKEITCILVQRVTAAPDCKNRLKVLERYVIPRVNNFSEDFIYHSQQSVTACFCASICCFGPSNFKSLWGQWVTTCFAVSDCCYINLMISGSFPNIDSALFSLPLVTQA
jgi:hypothetical protein